MVVTGLSRNDSSHGLATSAILPSTMALVNFRFRIPGGKPMTHGFQLHVIRRVFSTASLSLTDRDKLDILIDWLFDWLIAYSLAFSVDLFICLSVFYLIAILSSIFPRLQASLPACLLLFVAFGCLFVIFSVCLFLSFLVDWSFCCLVSVFCFCLVIFKK